MADPFDDYDEKAEGFLQNVWDKRAEGLEVPAIDWSRPIRPDDVAFLLRKYPHLQIVNTHASFAEGYDVKFIEASNGWLIHDYGDAMSVSPGRLLYGEGYPPQDDDEEGGGVGEGDMTPGSGTIIKQSVDTAAELIAVAKTKGWDGVTIAAGTDLMQWAAWVACEEQGLRLSGYEPDSDAKAKRDRVRRLGAELGKGPARGFGRGR